jgi:SAM-dependent methyltransferase
VSWDPERYARHAGFVPELGKHVLALLEPRSGERILDLGCGDGVLSREIARSGARVIGADLSLAQLRAARAAGLEVVCARAEALAFRGAFDAVFSNAALHWVKRADAVLAGVRGALRAEGRFVAVLGAHGNVASVRAELHAALRRRGLEPEPVDPWYFPSADEYAALLQAHGFAVQELQAFERPTPLPGDLRDWLLTFAGC